MGVGLLSAVVADPACPCRPVLWRDGLLEECLVELTSPRKFYRAGVLEFLASASHAKEVQTALCRSTAMLATLAGCATTGRGRDRIAAVVIARNICLFRKARSAIVGNTEFMAMLTKHATVRTESSSSPGFTRRNDRQAQPGSQIAVIADQLCTHMPETGTQSRSSEMCQYAREAMWILLNNSNTTDRRQLWAKFRPVPTLRTR